ncbi:MAG TPA: glycosyltransferase family 8 protein [Chitinophagaceae bacterium]|nr:glycosyltransferase family 8 protein [Chitinophagaceae bacterium]
MHIAIAFDENYLTPVYALVTSIFLNNKDEVINIHAIATGITEAEKEELVAYVKTYNGAINFYKLDKSILDGFAVPENSYFTIAAYYRIFFPLLVPSEVEKLLYLDSDIIVIGNLRSLYETEIGKKPVGAKLELLGKPRPDLGIYRTDTYFNSGVLLFNNREWKHQNIAEKASQFIRDFPERMKCVDQDALNAVLVENWFRIDDRYNVLYQDVPKNLSASNLKSYLSDKVVIHFSMGEHKPWMILGKNRLRHLYHYYLKRSPRFSEKKYSDFKLSSRCIYNYSKIRLSELLQNYPLLFSLIKKAKSPFATKAQKKFKATAR